MLTQNVSHVVHRQMDEFARQEAERYYQQHLQTLQPTANMYPTAAEQPYPLGQSRVMNTTIRQATHPAYSGTQVTQMRPNLGNPSFCNDWHQHAQRVYQQHIQQPNATLPITPNAQSIGIFNNQRSPGFQSPWSLVQQIPRSFQPDNSRANQTSSQMTRVVVEPIPRLVPTNPRGEPIEPPSYPPNIIDTTPVTVVPLPRVPLEPEYPTYPQQPQQQRQPQQPPRQQPPKQKEKTPEQVPTPPEEDEKEQNQEQEREQENETEKEEAQTPQEQEEKETEQQSIESESLHSGGQSLVKNNRGKDPNETISYANQQQIRLLILKTLQQLSDDLSAYVIDQIGTATRSNPSTNPIVTKPSNQ